MLVVNTFGTLMHIILKNSKSKYKGAECIKYLSKIEGVTTDNTSQYHLMWSFIVKEKNPLNYNKKIKWLYK